MKIGLLVCAYDCADTIQECLKPWIEIEQEKTIDLDIAIISTVFQGFPLKDNEPTIKAMTDVIYKSKACVIANPVPLTEHEARNMPLSYLLTQQCDVIWLLDGDEFYTKEQIYNIAHRVETNPFIVWWSIPFKNYVFDGKQYLDGFCPPRIFRTQMKSRILKEFYWDNDIIYGVSGTNETIDYKHLASASIPKSVACVRHMTWLHKNGKDKVEYQIKHFGACSYKWNEETEKLEFDRLYYLNRNLPLPVIKRDE